MHKFHIPEGPPASRFDRELTAPHPKRAGMLWNVTYSLSTFLWTW